MLDKQLSENGYVHLGVISPELSTKTVAKKIGEIFVAPNFPPVQRLTPKPETDAPKNIYSGNYGLGGFPMHTDLAHWYLPPRYFILRSITPSPAVSTLVLHNRVVLEGLSPITVKRAMFRPRRKLENKMYLLRFIQDEIFRWDEVFLIPTNEEARAVSEHFKSLHDVVKPNKVAFQKTGETLLIDNWKVLHGRTSVPESGTNRLIERVYLSEVRF